MTRYTYTTSMSWGGDTPTAELDDITVTYGVDWGAPAKGPSYASGGQPADPDEITDVEIVSIDGKPWADYASFGEVERKYLHEAILDRLEMDHWDQMLEAAADQRGYPDD